MLLMVYSRNDVLTEVFYWIIIDWLLVILFYLEFYELKLYWTFVGLSKLIDWSFVNQLLVKVVLLIFLLVDALVIVVLSELSFIYWSLTDRLIVILKFKKKSYWLKVY